MKIRLNDLLEGAKEATITAWHVDERGRVSKDQDMVEVATDKATFDVPSPCDGVVAKIFKREGETVKTDEAIAEITDDRKQKTEDR